MFLSIVVIDVYSRWFLIIDRFQENDEMANALPGMSVDVIVTTDFLTDKIEIRRAIVYDVAGSHFILSQTTPLMRQPLIGKDVDVAFVFKTEDNLRARFRFTAKVVDIMEKYEISSSEKVPAVILEQTSDPVNANLRQHYRVRAKATEEPILFLEGRKVNLLDVSLGGAQFSHDKHHAIQTGALVKMTMTLDRKLFPIDGKVLRAWTPPSSWEWQFVAVDFLTKDRELDYLLGRRIMMLEREYLTKL